MKAYEAASRLVLPGRMPVIIRVDGKAFHSYTRGLNRPWDTRLMDAMDAAAIALCKNIQGAQLAYVQSDEISILIHNYKNHNSQGWFNNQIQKMVSVSASIAGTTLTVESQKIFGEIRPAYFDSRAFVIPESDVCNYFLWRQQDACRNSIQMLARSMYSHKELNNKNTKQLHALCCQKGKDWTSEPTRFRRGRCIVRSTYESSVSSPMAPFFQGGNGVVIRSKWTVDNEIPDFGEDRNYINRFLVEDRDDN
jgi:tRNA(His) 5'-end guanylyltransferase